MNTLTRIGLGIGAIAITGGLVTGAYLSAQDTGGPRGPFAERHGGPRGFGGPMGALGPLLAAHLNLTDAQKAQLKGIVDSHRDEWKGLGDRAMEARQAVHSAVTADAVDEGLIRARAAELATIESDLAVARARIHAEVFQILTPEQQAQAREAQSQMQQRQNRRRHRASQAQPHQGQ
jgi:Spy/CpxP family protein refolding chaperone